MYPENYSYTKEHEWVSVAGDIGTIGITHHAQKELAPASNHNPIISETRREPYFDFF